MLLNGCVTPPKGLEANRAEITNLPSIQKVDYQCQCRTVRLGGKVLDAVALKDNTKLEILSLPIDLSSAKPNIEAIPDGRFIAYLPGFIDPEFIKDQYITVAGILTLEEQGKIDQINYRYPVIAVNTYKQWKLVKKYYRTSPYWNDFRFNYYRFDRGFPYDGQSDIRIGYDLY